MLDIRAAGLAVCFLLAAAPVHAVDTVDVAAAKREGKLVLYTSAPIEIAQKLVERFQAKYGIAGELFRSGGSAVLNRFQQEIGAGHIGADIVAVSDAGAFAALAAKGIFVAFKPDGFDQVPDAAKDPNGYYVAQRVSVVATYGRSDLVPEMPQSWDALLEPRFRGKLVLTDPSFTSLQLAVIAMLSRQKGWDYYEKLSRNQVMVVQSQEQALNMVKSGERPIAAGAESNYARDAQAAGHKIAIAIPSDGTFVIPASTAIVKGSPHPNAAKLFAEYLLSAETQAMFAQNGIYGGRTDIAPPDGSPALSDIKLIPMDFDYVEKVTKSVKTRFNEIFQ